VKATFCSSGKYEFDLETDAGIGSDFWNGKISPAACNNRMKRVYGLSLVHFSAFFEIVIGYTGSLLEEDPCKLCETYFLFNKSIISLYFFYIHPSNLAALKLDPGLNRNTPECHVY